MNSLIRSYKKNGKNANTIFELFTKGGASISEVGFIHKFEEHTVIRGNALACAAYHGVSPVMSQVVGPLKHTINDFYTVEKLV